MTCRALELNAEIAALNALTDRIEAGEPSEEWTAMVVKADDLWGVMRHVEPSTPEGAQVVALAFADWLECATARLNPAVSYGEWLGSTQDGCVAADAVRKAAQGQSGVWPLLRVVTAAGGAGEARGLVRYLRAMAVAT